jgi:hypothetical protein
MAASDLVRDARRLAYELLRTAPERWAHTVAVATGADRLAGTVSEDQRDRLVAAAWLHDIGYSPALVAAGFHPLDGAHHLDRLAWPASLSVLVAHHSGARFVAAAAGLAEPLRLYPFEDSLTMDTLTYADQIVGPGGRPCSPELRMADMLRRHGPDSPNARAHQLRGPYLRAVVARVEGRLARMYVGHPPTDHGC